MLKFKERIIGIIPTRYQSTRFPGKLLAPISGKALLEHTYINSLRCKSLDQIYIATDDERISNLADRLKAPWFMTSPSCVNGTARIIEAMEKNKELRAADLIVNFQGDHPFTSPKTIHAMIEWMQKDKEAVMATAAVLLTDERKIASSHVVKCTFDHENTATYFSRAPIPCRRQTYYHHLGVYCYRKEFLLKLKELPESELEKAEDLEQMRPLEARCKIKIAVVEDMPLSVDTPEDVNEIEEYLACL